MKYLIVPLEDPASRSVVDVSSDRNLAADTLEDAYSENILLLKFENGNFYEATVQAESKEDDEEENEGETFYIKDWSIVK